MRKKFLIASNGPDGAIDLQPLMDWLRRHPDQVPPGMTPDGSTSHQLRGGLKKLGWVVVETEEEVRIFRPEIAKQLAAQAVDTEGAVRVTTRPSLHELVPITLTDLNDASTSFQQLEKRGSFYDMALGLVRAGYEIEGCVLFLATWNFASFRYAATNFDIDGLKNVLSTELSGDFAALSQYDLQNIDLAVHGSRIETVFDRLASMKEVLFTGATKLMHLKCPATFVIWDDYIRGGKPEKHYMALPCVLSKKWCFRSYDRTGKGYVLFLSDVQNRVRDLQYPTSAKSLAKAIDEFNYVNVTLPIQKLEEERKARREADKERKTAALRQLGRTHTSDELERLAQQRDR
jgi:hypothetical protein